MKNFTLLLALLSLGAGLIGCGSGGDHNGRPTLPTAASLPAACTTIGVGASYNCQITITGGKAPFKWTVTGLPAGLSSSVSADTTTLTISGTPTGKAAVVRAFGATRHSEATSTSSTVQIGVTDAKGQTSSLSFTVAVSALAISTTSLPSGTVGTAYSTTVAASGGASPYNWTITGLPGGLSPSGASISGTPTVSGTFTVKVSVTDSAASPANVQVTLSLTIAPAPALAITTTSLPGGTAGMAYSDSVSATGGVAPYTWTITGLPSGLMLTGANISGTTDNVGTFSVKVAVSDSQSPPATTSVTLSLVISQAATLTISTTSLPNGTVNVSYSQTLTATGGVTTYNWTLASGTLPTGLSISAAGVISGTPTATGTFSFTIKVTDAESPAQTATQALSITINAATSGLNITTSSPLPVATLSSAYTTTVTATGGTPPYTFTLGSSSSLPKGLALSSGSPSATIAGTPTATGTFQFTVDVKDSAGTPATASASFLVTVTGSSSFTCPSPANPSMPLCGTNFFEVEGVPASGQFTATLAVLLIDNNRNVISGEATNNDSANGYTTHTITGGNYVMDSSGDGRGVLTVIDSTAASATYRFAVFSAANYKPGPIEQFDSSGVLADGITAIVPSTPVPQIPANTVLGAQFIGGNSAGHKVGALGSFQVGPNGCDGSSGSFNSQTGETIVVNSGGTVTTGLTATGSCTAVNANGMGTAQITLSGGTPFTNNTLHFTYFEYNNASTPTFAIFLSSDSIGTNQPVIGGPLQANPEAGQITSSLFASYCGGSTDCAGRQSGTSGSGNVDTIKALFRFAATSTSGTAGTLSGTYDQNAAGTITANAAWPYTAYDIDANGVGTFTGSGQKTIHVIYNNGGLYSLDESSQVLTGDFDQQNSVTVENPGSNYVLTGNSPANGSTHFLGILVPTGTTTAGTLPGVVDVISNVGSSAGAIASGAYTSLSATGRSTGTANFTNGATAINTVIYIARHRRFWVLDVQSTTPYIADVILQ